MLATKKSSYININHILVVFKVGVVKLLGLRHEYQQIEPSLQQTLWFNLRINSIANADINQSVVGKDNSPYMAYALQIYLHLKAGKKPHTFATGANRKVLALEQGIQVNVLY